VSHRRGPLRLTGEGVRAAGKALEGVTSTLFVHCSKIRYFPSRAHNTAVFLVSVFRPSLACQRDPLMQLLMKIRKRFGVFITAWDSPLTANLRHLQGVYTSLQLFVDSRVISHYFRVKTPVRSAARPAATARAQRYCAECSGNVRSRSFKVIDVESATVFLLSR